MDIRYDLIDKVFIQVNQLNPLEIAIIIELIGAILEEKLYTPQKLT